MTCRGEYGACGKPVVGWLTLCWDCLAAQYGIMRPTANFGPGMWGFGAPTVKADPPPTDTDIEDTVRERIETWDRERQIIAYKLLYGLGHRIGPSCDHALGELRRQRHKAEKEA